MRLTPFAHIARNTPTKSILPMAVQRPGAAAAGRLASDFSQSARQPPGGTPPHDQPHIRGRERTTLYPPLQSADTIIDCALLDSKNVTDLLISHATCAHG